MVSCQGLAQWVDGGGAYGRPENEGPGDVLVLAQALGAGGRGRFKDDSVRAGLTERAQPHLAALGDAHQPTEGHAESAAQRVALAEGGKQ